MEEPEANALAEGFSVAEIDAHADRMPADMLRSGGADLTGPDRRAGPRANGNCRPRLPAAGNYPTI
jgi:hypothetical protein